MQRKNVILIDAIISETTKDYTINNLKFYKSSAKFKMPQNMRIMA